MVEAEPLWGVWGYMEAWAASRWDSFIVVKVETEALRRDLNGMSDSIFGFLSKHSK